MVRLKSRRLKRYGWLRNHHFTFREAVMLSRLRYNYPALEIMTKQRSALWMTHIRALGRVGADTQSPHAHREWLRRVRKFYVDRKLLVEKDTHGRQYKRKQLSPWGLYDLVYRKLPPEDQWDTPRGHRRKPKHSELRMDKIIKLKVIKDAKRELETERDPNRVMELQDRLRSLGQ